MVVVGQFESMVCKMLFSCCTLPPNNEYIVSENIDCFIENI